MIQSKAPLFLLVLARVKHLLQLGWTTAYSALDAHDNVVSIEDSCAVKWCLYGALARACSNLRVGDTLQVELVVLLNSALGGSYRDLVDFNDHQSESKPVIELVEAVMDKIILEESLRK